MTETEKPLTKHQKKMLKKEAAKQRLQEKRKAQKRKENTRKILKYAGILVVIIAAAFLVLTYKIYSIWPDPETSPVLRITPDSINLGDVSVSNGPITTSIKVENAGKEDLILNDMESSCLCTSAALVYEGVEGPRFGMKMHGNPTGWNVTIKPGDTASLKIYYDPTVHEGLRGPITRTITIYSNDPNPKNSVKTVYVNLNQID